MGFLKGNSLPKLVVTCDFITQSWLLGGRTPQPPRRGRCFVPRTLERISFSVGCLQAAADIFVII
ncbi:MAG: hypothetical protein EWV41_18215 [Microcystis wesenbergii Mw_MB_S_20031200_S109]|uniref:Uncharacterized protein n=1 Tax=Microcystis wesenbergii Mw_MB_S_20031200_S109D TaxID=2486241 RepID=A0A552LW70_9CHRO|nr:MAG: hypothetical protein EWV41_18215 [Microcystis wesenbergii Mw_MB_S_20031200_S109]TRV24463.1 MAG: hypothetical protein EWV88_09515 [Microcystis wesenbergii Mw_MB_S_20031200_S109D]